MRRFHRRTHPGSSSGTSHSQQIAHPDQVPPHHGHLEQRIDPRLATLFDLPDRTDHLAPAERLFHAFALALADGITRMPPGALVDRTAFILGRDMGGDAQLAALLDERFHVVAPVRAHRLATFAGQRLQQFQRGVALGCAGGVTDLRTHHQSVAVLHHCVALIAQHRRGVGRLAVQPRVRISGRRVRVVLALLPLEVAFLIAADTARAFVLRTEALVRSPAWISVPSTLK